MSEKKIEEWKKKRELLLWTFKELVRKARDEGVEKYQDKLYDAIYSLVRLEYEPFLNIFTEALSWLTALEKKAKAGEDALFYTMVATFRFIFEQSKIFVTMSMRDKAENFYSDVLIGLKINERLKEIYEMVADLARLMGSVGKLPQELQQKLCELEEKIKVLEKQRIEISLRVEENIESELKEWLREREKAKKAMEGYIG